MSAGDDIESAGVEVLKAVGPELAKAALGLLRGALAGESEDQIKAKSDKLLAKTLFKAAYHRGKTT